MAKKIKNPISTVVTRVDGIFTCRADYGVESEGIEARRSMVVTLKENTIKDVDGEVMEQIFAHEGTEEMYVEPEPVSPDSI